MASIASFVGGAASFVGSIAEPAGQIVGGFAAARDAQREARFRRDIGRIEAADKRRSTRRLLASQTVAFAASGVDPGTGTPLDVHADTIAEGELAALRLQFRREFEARAVSRRGQQAFTRGIIGGGAPLLGKAFSFVSGLVGGEEEN